jgi:S13-like protein
MALRALSAEQRQAALQKAREARAARSDLLADLKAGTVTLADVLGRHDDPQGKGRPCRPRGAWRRQARATAIMEYAGIPAERRTGGLGARQRKQLLGEFPASDSCPFLMPSPQAYGRCPVRYG